MVIVRACVGGVTVEVELQRVDRSLHFLRGRVIWQAGRRLLLHTVHDHSQSEVSASRAGIHVLVCCLDDAKHGRSGVTSAVSGHLHSVANDQSHIIGGIQLQSHRIGCSGKAGGAEDRSDRQPTSSVVRDREYRAHLDDAKGTGSGIEAVFTARETGGADLERQRLLRQ